MSHGTETNEVCNRDGCIGIIQESEAHGCCSCHTNPPCSYCVDDRHYCPVCNWQGIDEQRSHATGAQGLYNRVMQKKDNHHDKIGKMMKGELPIDGFHYRNLSHTHFSMIKEGVYPEGMTSEQVLEKVKGSFGGRFERFSKGVFKYIAYTD